MRQQALILVVDDQPEGRGLLRRVLESQGHRVKEAGDGVEALRLVDEDIPDLVLTDVVMPKLDGYEVCKRIKRDPRYRLLPVVILTSLDQIPDKVKALELDADDYLTKPYNLTELSSRVRSLLRLKHYTDELENASAVLHAIASIVEKRDMYVSDHCREVGFLAGRVGGMLGLKDEALARLRLGATFHDIGKIAVEDSVLHKTGPLDPAQLALMRQHPVTGAELLEPMKTLKDVVPLIRHHHERLDGSGYPDRLKAEQISLEVRILSVVDVYQALVSQRPYKPALSKQKALEILRQESERGWWDADVVEALNRLVFQPEPE